MEDVGQRVFLDRRDLMLGGSTLAAAALLGSATHTQTASGGAARAGVASVYVGLAQSRHS